MNEPIKILFFADTHLGYDNPLNPRVERRRRGDDFFTNYLHVLDVARKQKVDLVVHGGDFFFRSKVPSAIVERAYQPLLDLANAGIPIFIVPGNHDRSRLPAHLWLTHQNIQVFDQPKTYLHPVGDRIIALSGFPFTREVKDKFPALIRQTAYQEYQADIHYLCLHQTMEGAQVGPVDFTFRAGPDNIPGEWIPDQFHGVLSGHIHRAQQLTRSLDNRDLAVPVIYPGSIERTSFAERFEDKYYVMITVFPGKKRPRQIFEYHQLPARPMIHMEIPVEDRNLLEVKYLIKDRLTMINSESIVRIDLTGPNADEIQRSLTAAGLRAVAPLSMNINLKRELQDSSSRSKAELIQP
jgi:DNA repair exonuclease SbcCD nuclease subunit